MIAVVDLNRVFSSNALHIDGSMTTKALPARSQATATSAPSFNDALAGVQDSLTASQNETRDHGILVPQFQDGTSCRPLMNSRQNQNGSEMPDAIPQDTQQQSSSSRAAYIQGREDVHAGSDTFASNADKHPTRESKIEPHGDGAEPQATRDTTRSKQHKTASHSAKAGSVADDVHDANPALVEDMPTKQLDTTLEVSRQDPMAAVDTRGASPAAVAPPGNARLNNKEGDLAFAVKVQSNNAATEVRPAPMNQADSASLQVPDVTAQLASPEGAVATMPVTDADAKTSKAEQQDAEGMAMMPESALPAPSLETAFTKPTSPQEVTTIREIPEEPATPVQPVKAVQVQIAGADNQRVDLRLIEKSGLLTMSVRSSDGTLTRALQQNLPDLAGKLNDQQIRAEWWKPGVAQAEQGQIPDTPAHKEFREHAGNQQQANQDRNGQQSGRKTPQPDWVDELANLRKSNQIGTQYSWHL